ncbi:MAG TPA: response regulator [Candidatus Thermoplasmatota archaeon]|nr:response regulator [Candidatus Thermoplasmatota archaeon]
MASLRVLLVDARRATRRGWRDLLASIFPGCVVEEAQGVTEAWGLVRTRVYDLVLADALLPDGSGVDLLDKARAACPGALRVLLSGGPHPDAAREAVRRGVAHAALPKQAPLADATETLRRLVGGRGAD